MSAERSSWIAELKKLLELITQGPWSPNGRDVLSPAGPVCSCWHRDAGHAALNAAFIAGCRSHVPTLIAELESQAAVIQRLREVLATHGAHTLDCLMNASTLDCTCGYSAALASSGVPSPENKEQP